MVIVQPFPCTNCRATSTSVIEVSNDAALELLFSSIPQASIANDMSRTCPKTPLMQLSFFEPLARLLESVRIVKG